MGKTYEDLIRAIEDLKQDVGAQDLIFLNEKMGKINYEHTRDFNKSKDEELDFTMLAQDHQNYARRMREQYRDTMQEFTKSSNEAIKHFGEQFINEYGNIFDSVAKDIKRQSNHIIQTNSKATTSEILSVDRQIQSYIHSATKGLTTYLEQAVTPITSASNVAHNIVSARTQGTPKGSKLKLDIEPNKELIRAIKQSTPISSSSRISVPQYGKQTPLSKKTVELIDEYMGKPNSTVFYDTETVGTRGAKNSGITEIAYKLGNNDVKSLFTELPTEALNDIITNIKHIREGNLHKIKNRDQVWRSIKRMSQYRLGSDNKIYTEQAAGIEDIILTKEMANSELLNFAEKAIEIFSGKGIDGKTAPSNLTRLPNNNKSITGYKQIFEQIFNGAKIRVAHNANYDESYVRESGIAAGDVIDMLDLARKTLKIGQKNATTGKRLLGYRQSDLADFFGIQTGSAHVGAEDVRFGSKVFEALVNHNLTEGNLLNPKILHNNYVNKGSIVRATKSIFRHNPHDFVMDKDGNILGIDKETDSYASNRGMTAGSYYESLGTEDYNYNGTKMRYSKWRNLDNGNVYWREGSATEQGEFVSGLEAVDISKISGMSSPEAFEQIMRSYQWSSLKGIFGKSDGNRTAHRQAQYDALKKGTYLQQAQKIYDQALKLEQQGWTEGEINQVLNQTFGGFKAFSLEDLNPNLRLAVNPQKIGSALLDILASSDEIFGTKVGKSEVEDMRSAIRNAQASGDETALHHIKSWISNNVLSSKKKAIEGSKEKGYNSKNALQLFKDNIETYAQSRASVATELIDGVTKKIPDFAGKLYKDNDVDIQAMLTGKYLKSKYSKVGVNDVPELSQFIDPTEKMGKNGVPYLQFAEDSVGHQLNRMAQAAINHNFGLNANINKNTGELLLDVFSANNPENAIKVKMPTINKDGSLLFGNMKLSNFGIRQLDRSGKTKVIGAQEYAAKALADFFEGGSSFELDDGSTIDINRLNSMITAEDADLGKIGSILNSIVRRSIQSTSSLGTSAINGEIADLAEAGDTPETMALRSYMMHNNAWLRQLVKTTTAGKLDMQNGDSYAMSDKVKSLMQYMTAITSNPDNSNIYAQNENLAWLTSEESARVLGNITDTVRNFHDGTTALKEEAINSSWETVDTLRKNIETGTNYTAVGTSAHYLPGGAHDIGRTAEQDEAGTQKSTFTADMTYENMKAENLAKENIVSTNMAEQLGIPTDDAAHGLFKYARVTDEQIMQAYQTIAQGSNKSLAKIAQQAIDTYTVPSIENDMAVFTGNRDTIGAFEVSMPKNKTVTKEELLNIVSGNGIKLKNLPNNQTPLDYINDFIQNSDRNIEFVDSYKVGNGYMPLSVNGKPIFSSGDIIEQIVKTEDGRYSLIGSSHMPMGMGRLMIGNNSTKATVTGMHNFVGDSKRDIEEATLQGDFNKALLSQLGLDNGVQFLLKNETLKDARKPSQALREELVSALNTIHASENSEPLLKQFKQLQLNNGVTLGEALFDSNSMNPYALKTDYGDNYNAILQSIFGLKEDSGQVVEDNIISKFLQSNGLDTNVKWGHVRTTQGTNWFKSGERYKWGARSKRALSAMLDSISDVPNGGITKEQASGFKSRFEQGMTKQMSTFRDSDAIIKSLKQTTGILDGNDGEYLELLTPDEYVKAWQEGNISNKMNVGALSRFVTDHTGAPTKESYQGIFGKINQFLKDKGYTGAKLKLPTITQSYMDYDGSTKEVPFNEVYVPNIDRSDEDFISANISAAEKGIMQIISQMQGGFGNTEGIKKSTLEYFKNAGNEVFHKEGRLFEEINSPTIGNSAWFTARGSNVENQAEGARMLINSAQATDILSGYNEITRQFGGSNQDLADTLKQVLYQYTSATTQMQENAVNSKLSDSQMRAFDKIVENDSSLSTIIKNEDVDKAVQGIINGKKNQSSTEYRARLIKMLKKYTEKTVALSNIDTFGNNAVTLDVFASRQPETSWMGEYVPSLYTSDKQVDKGQAIISNAFQGLMGGDFDGDTLRAMGIGSVGNFENYEAFSTYKKNVVQEMRKYTDLVTKHYGQLEGNKDSQQKTQDITEIIKQRADLLDTASKKEVTTTAEIANKFNKALVGQFSNRSSGVKTAIEQELGSNASWFDKIITGAIYQTPEEEAISAKHAIDNASQLIDKNGNLLNQNTLAHGAMKTWNDVNSIWDIMNNLASGKGSTVDDLFAQMKQVGYIDKNGFLKGKAAKMASSQLLGMSEYHDAQDSMIYLRKILSQSNYTDDQITSFIEGIQRGEIHQDLLKGSYGTIDKMMHQKTGKGLDANAWLRKNAVSAKKILEGQELWGLQQAVDRITGGHKTAFEKNAVTVTKYDTDGNVISGNNNIVDQNSMQSANVIINATSAVVNSNSTTMNPGQTDKANTVAKTTSQTTTSTQPQGVQTKAANLVEEGHVYRDGDKVLQNLGGSASKVSAGVFGQDYSNILDYSNNGDTQSLATLKGSLIHKELEYIDKFRHLISSDNTFNNEIKEQVSKSNSVSDIIEILQKNGYTIDTNGVWNGQNNYITSALNEHFQYRQSWHEAMGAHGYDANSTLAEAQKAVQTFSMMEDNVAGNKIASELSLRGHFGQKGTETPLTIDGLYYDKATHTFSVGDYKSGKYHAGQTNLQLSQGNYAIEDLFKQFVDLRSNTTNPMTAEQILNHLGLAKNIGEIATNRIAHAFEDAYLWQSKDVENKVGFKNIGFNANGYEVGTGMVYMPTRFTKGKVDEAVDKYNNSEKYSVEEQEVMDQASKGETIRYKKGETSVSEFYKGLRDEIHQTTGEISLSSTATQKEIEDKARVDITREAANTVLSLQNKLDSEGKLSTNEQSQLALSKTTLGRAMFDLKSGQAASGLDANAFDALQKIVTCYQSIVQASAQLNAQTQQYITLCEKITVLEQQRAQIKAKVANENRNMTKEEQDSVDNITKSIEELNTERMAMEEGSNGARLREIGARYAVDTEMAIANIEAGVEAKGSFKKNDGAKTAKESAMWKKKALDWQKEYDRYEEKITKTRKAIEASGSNFKRVGEIQQVLTATQDQIADANRRKISVDTNGNVSQMVQDPTTRQYKMMAVMGDNGQPIKLNEGDLSSYRQELEKQSAAHTTKMAQANVSQRTFGTFVGEVMGNMKNTLRYITNTSIAYGVIGKVKQTFTTMISTVESLDKAMVDLQIATGNTRDEMSKSVSEYNKIAMEMGRTTQEVMQAANDWLRAGFDTKDTNALVQESMKLSTLGMIDPAKATEYLISTKKGWNISTEDMSQVVDELTTLDMAYATSAGDIAQAMSKANVSASLSGVDRQQYESMLTAVMDVGQQGADVVGTAFKSLFSRYGNVKAGKYAKTYDSTDSETDMTALNDVETVLNKMGIKTREAVGEFRDMYDVLEEISKKWVTMDEVSQNAISTALGGTRQREVLNTLFENWDSVKKGEKIVASSEGTANKKMDIYENSIQAAKTRMTTALESNVTDGEVSIMGMSFKMEDVLINIYDVLTDLISNLEQLINVGLGLLVITKGKAIGQVAVNTLFGAGAALSGMGSKIGYGIRNITDVPQNMGNYFKNTWNEASQKKFNMALEESAQAMNKQNAAAETLTDQFKLVGTAAQQSAKDILTKAGYGVNKAFANMSQESRGMVLDMARVDENTYGLMKTQTLGANKLQSLYGQMGIQLDATTMQAIKSGDIQGFNKEGAIKSLQESENISYKEAEQRVNKFAAEIEKVTQALVENGAELKKATAAETEEEMADRRAAQSALDKMVADEQGTIAEQNETIANNESTASELREAAAETTGVGRITGQQAIAMQGYMSDPNYKKNANTKFSGGANMAASMGGMAASMIIGSAMSNSNMSSRLDQKYGEGTGGTVSTIATLAPSIGAMFGPWGLLAGGMVSLGTLLFGAITTQGEYTREELEEMNSSLDGIREDIQTATETLDNLRDNEGAWEDLIKGVNQQTGENISLNDSEWTQYQEILSSIIEANDELYASYDANGDIIAKNKNQVADLNSVMEDTIKLQKQKLIQEQHQLAVARDKDNNEIYTIMSGVQTDVEDAYNQYKDDIKAEQGKILDTINTLNGAIIRVDNQNLPDYVWQDLQKIGALTEQGVEHYKKAASSNNLKLLANMFNNHSQNFNQISQETIDYLNGSHTITQDGKEITVGNLIDTDGNQITIDFKNLQETELKQLLEKQDAATRQAFSKGLSSSVGSFLMGDDEFNTLSNEAQSFIKNDLFGNIQANPYKHGKSVKHGATPYMFIEPDILRDLEGNSKVYEKYIQYANAIAAWGSESKNSYQMSILSNYDQNTATALDDQNYKQALIQMMTDNGLTNDPTYMRHILSGMGYTNSQLDGAFDFDEKTQLWKLTEDGLQGLKTKRESLTSELSGDYSTENILNKLTTSELENLKKYESDISTEAKNNINLLKSELQKLSVGTNGTTSQYFAQFTAELKALGLEADSTQEILDSIASREWKNVSEQSYAFEQLNKQVTKYGISLEKLIENIEVFSDIDMLGHTSKKLTDVQSDFETLSNAMSDLRDNGRLTTENLQALIEQYPDTILPILNDTTKTSEDLLSRIEDIYELQAVKTSAPIKTALDNNSKVYIDDVNNLNNLIEGKSNDLTEESKKILKSFGNATNIQTINNNLKQYGGDDYFKLGKDTKSHTLEKDLMDMYNIDRTGDYSEAQEKLKDKIIEQLTDAGLDQKVLKSTDYSALMSQYSHIVQDDLFGAFAEYENAKNHLAALENSKNLIEDQRWEEAIKTTMSDLSQAYSDGTMSQDEYISKLQELQENEHLTAEQAEELAETLEDLELDKLSDYFTKGQKSDGSTYTGEEYRKDLRSKLKNNAEGTSDRDSIMQSILGSYDTENSMLDTKINKLTDDNDFNGVKSLYQQKIENGYKKLAELESAGYSRDNQEWINAENNLINDNKALFDFEKSDLEDRYNRGEVSLTDYINGLEDLKDSSSMTADQLDELNEVIEESKSQLASYRYDEGKITGDQYRDEIMKLMGQNEVGSEDWIKYRNEYIGSFGSDQSKIDTQISLLDDDNYNQREAFLKQKKTSSEQEIASLLALGYSKDSAEVLKAQANYKDILEDTYQIASDKMADFEEDYNRGDISLTDYISSMETLINTTDLTEDQLKEFKEQLAKANKELYDYSYKTGTGKNGKYYSGAKYREDMAKDYINYKEGTPKSQEYESAILSSFDSDMNKVDAHISMLDENQVTEVSDENKNKSKDLNKDKKVDYYEEKTSFQETKIRLAGQKVATLRAWKYDENSPEMLSAKQDLYKALQGKREILDEKKSGIEEDYNRGAMGLDDYNKKLNSLINSTDASAEQVEQWTEELEESKSKLADLNYQMGKTGKDADGNKLTAAETYRESQYDILKKNDSLSEDALTAKQNIISSYDTENSKIDLNNELLNDTDYIGRINNINKKIENSKNKLLNLYAQGYTDNSTEVKNTKKDILDSISSKADVTYSKREHWKEEFDQGTKSIIDYRNNLNKLSEDTNLTAEQLKNLAEEIEELNLQIAEQNYENGVTSDGKLYGLQDYQDDLFKELAKNIKGSDDYNAIAQQIFSSFESEVARSESQQALISEVANEDNIKSRKDFIGTDIQTLQNSLAYLEARGLKNSKLYLDTLNKVVAKEKEKLELDKQQYEYQKKMSEEVLDSYSQILDYGLNELQKKQESINELYDDEISKLQEINDQKQRSIELTKLQQELENAKKEKSRVYVAGIGWTYQENKAKVKEAKQNLENYLDERKIQDLQFAQKKETELIQQEIDALNDIKEYISDIKTIASTQASVLDLIKNGIGIQDMTIDQMLALIRGEAKIDENGKVVSLGDTFEDHSGKYTDSSNNLAEYEDNYDSNIDGISNKYINWENPAESVASFVSKLKTNPKDIAGDTAQDKLMTFLGENITDSAKKEVKEMYKGFEEQAKANANKEGTKKTDDEILKDFLQSDVFDKWVKEYERQYNNSGAETKEDENTGDSLEDKVKAFMGSKTLDQQVAQIKKDFQSVINEEDPKDSEKRTINEKISDFLGGKKYKDWMADLKQAYKEAKPTVSSTVNMPDVDMSDVTEAINNAKSEVTNCKTKLGSIETKLKNGFESLLPQWTSYNDVLAAGFEGQVMSEEVWNRIPQAYTNKNSQLYNKEFQSSYKDYLAYQWGKFIKGAYSTGIENGPVAYTGLAMLHGSPSNPEYVLNSDQAYTLLKNLSTMMIPQPYQTPIVDSYRQTSSSVAYQFYGDLHLPNVQRPDQFFDELLRQANAQFGTIKKNYD